MATVDHLLRAFLDHNNVLRQRIRSVPKGRLGCANIPLLVSFANSFLVMGDTVCRKDEDIDCRCDDRYTMLAVFPIIYFGWKFIKKVGPTDPVTVDVFREEKRVIDDYEEQFIEVKSSWSVVRAWDKLFIGKY